jgi:hypothetical protein
VERFEDLPCLEWRDSSGQARRLYPNVMTSETVSLESDVTEHPVEEGVDVTDHISPKPVSLTLELYFTDTVTRPDVAGNPAVLSKTLELPDPPSLGLFATVTSTTNIINAIGDLLGGEKKKYVASYYEAPSISRLHEAQAILERLRNEATLVTAFTSIGVYEELLVQIVTTVVDNTTGKNGGRISLNLKHIRFVQSDVTLALPIGPVRAQPKKDAGKGGKTVEEPKGSALKKTTDATGLTTKGSGVVAPPNS